MKQDLTEPEPLQLMLNKLAFRGLDVTRAPGYSVSVGDASLYKQELDLLRNGQVDVLGITSELEVEGLKRMLSNSWESLCQDISVVCNGRETAQSAAALGLPVTVLGTKVASGEDFVHALADHCSSKRGLQIYQQH
jgi:uroporphyrinogen-III synthase